MSELTREEQKELLKLVDEARARGDEDEADRLMASVPLSKKMTEYFVSRYGEESARNSGFKLYGDKYERPICK